jgi:hypothetical protein
MYFSSACVDNTKADLNNRDAAVVTFPGPTYVLPFSLLALVVVLLARYACYFLLNGLR